jgi:hypothetical protein
MNAHNIYLQLLTEYGLQGLFALLVLILTGLWRLLPELRALQRFRPLRHRACRCSHGGRPTGAAHFFVNPFFLLQGTGQFWMMAGVSTPSSLLGPSDRPGSRAVGPGKVTMAGVRPERYPEGKRFAFSIVDDTDCGTVQTLEPVYAVLRELGLRTTKTVWVRRSSMPDQFDVNSETLESPGYLDFVRALKADGFEIAMHTAAPGARCAPRRSPRTTGSGPLRRGPVMNVNHSMNRENLYWGRHRLDGALRAILYDRTAGRHVFEGHVENSPTSGETSAGRGTRYVGLHRAGIDALAAKPSMPYHDPRRPHVALWYPRATEKMCPIHGADLRRSSGSPRARRRLLSRVHASRQAFRRRRPRERRVAARGCAGSPRVPDGSHRLPRSSTSSARKGARP